MVRIFLDMALARPRLRVHDTGPLSLRDLVFPYVEAPADSNPMLRSFVLIPSGFVGGRAHEETTPADPHHVHGRTAG